MGCTRALCFVEKGGVRLVNRRRREMLFRYPDLAFLSSLPPGTVLDGEIVVICNGVPDFASLQVRDQAQSARKIATVARSRPATYIIFDQLYQRYQSIMDQPLWQRREAARSLIAQCGNPQLIMSEGIIGQGCRYFETAVERGLEGIVAKRLSSPYLSGKRTDCWIKVKRQETFAAVVIGFVPEGERDFKALIVAVEKDQKLVSVGKVGSGFTHTVRDRINDFLWRHLCATPVVPCRIKGKWVEPTLYCQIRRMERTPGGQLRAPVFGGIYGGDHR
jgi:bifunctional non-homologous end joining protein LigD